MEQRSKQNLASSLSASQRAQLEERIRGAADAETEQHRIPARPEAVPLAMSTGQQRLWFLHKVDPDSAAYTMFRAVRLEGDLDMAAMRRAVDDVVARHESLRTRFPDSGQSAQPVVVEPAAADMQFVELDATVRREDALSAARQTVSAFVRKPFDLASGPLFRAMLVRIGDADHVFAVAMHHIISDEWSMDIIWRDLVTAYSASGQTASDRDPSRTGPAADAGAPSYFDFAHWQHQRRDDPALDRQLRYWRGRLADLLPLDLPTDRPRPVRNRRPGGIEKLDLSAELTTRLHDLRKQHGATLFVILLATFHVVLHRYTSSRVTAVGVPVTARTYKELEDVVGFFLNTLVMPADFDGDLTFVDLLNQMRKTVLEGFANQDVPFEQIVDDISPVRELGRNPLFQVMFVLQQESSVTPLAPHIGTTDFPVSNEAAKFDMTLFASDAGPRLRLAIEYNTDLFDSGTVKRTLAHVETVVRRVVDRPESRVSQIDFLPTAEKTQLAAFSAVDEPEAAELRSARALPRLHELVEKVATEYPNSVAVVFEDVELTYSELNRRGNAVAHALIEKGIGHGSRVGLCLGRTEALPIAIVGVLKSGAAYVPLDPTYPEQRLKYLIEDSAASLLLTEEVFASLSADTTPDRQENPGVAVAGSDAAYVIYTSGSSGAPKGVLVTHDNAVSSTLARRLYYSESPRRFLLLSSIAFDSAVAGLFWTLASGGTLVLPRQKQERDVAAVADLVLRQSVTHTLCIPSLYNQILTHATSAELAGLEVVVVAGEPCSAAVVRHHFERLPDTRLYNEYGPTEATVWCSVHEIKSDFKGTRVPIGRPVANARLYVLDAQGNRVPIGVAGALHVGGAGVATGYHNRPELTSERFLPDPFSPAASDGRKARMYRTGDRARFRSDGVLEFLGRTDGQIKIRGYRIEPGEVESALASHPDVREVAVVATSGARADGVDTVDSLVAALEEMDPDDAGALLDAIERLPGSATGDIGNEKQDWSQV